MLLINLEKHSRGQGEREREREKQRDPFERLKEKFHFQSHFHKKNLRLFNEFFARYTALPLLLTHMISLLFQSNQTQPQQVTPFPDLTGIMTFS